MKKTLLLCFIHGFKGGDDTFGNFPEHLRALVSHALPKVDVAAITYPKFETRGDLRECIGRFREWLQDKVVDLEVQKGTPSPMIDPSVRVILCGHSMGGIVAADTVLAITSEQPISNAPEATTFMFPYIQGILAFDTPYLGIAPGVVAHGAEGHYNTASTAFGAFSEVAGVFGWGASGQDKSNKDLKKAEAPKALPAAGNTKEAMAAVQSGDAAAVPAWQRWGKVAMFAGAAGAVAAGGAAAYMKREQITEGWTWVGSHLEFVGCLMRGEELKKRLVSVVKLEEDHGLGFADMFTTLGTAAASTSGKVSSGLVGEQRTFCVLPKSNARKLFIKQVNDAATDETQAHMSMFYPKDNPGYYRMSEQAKDLVVRWASNDWYESSTGEIGDMEVESEAEDQTEV
ncbi:MAG: hypothetical protein M1812_005486 [Candelaria pacifica]|nr:MAG: hypothetical protein M1812_005486 [Candelaria pacifica]